MKPGAERIVSSCSESQIQTLAFENNGQLTVTGMNPSSEPVYIGVKLPDNYDYRNFRVFRTCEFENCANITEPVVKISNKTDFDIEFIALSHSIFTVTNAT